MLPCTLIKTKKNIAKMLERIPFHDADGVSSEELCPSPERDAAACRQCVFSLLTFLQVFDVLNIRKDTKSGDMIIKASSEIATFFLKSLSQYISKDFKLTSDWDSPGIGKELLKENAFTSGAHLVYFIENKRIKHYHEKTAIRTAQISLGIIKAKVGGNTKPVYLFHWDAEAKQYQLIGGHVRSKDTDPFEVLKKEIREELSGEQLTYQKDYELKKIADNISFSDQSRTVGAFTEYKATLYQIIFKKPKIRFGPDNKWITWEELLQGKTKNNHRIANDTMKILNDKYAGKIKSLQLSL